MSEVTVRALGGDDWQTYRRIRLTALQDAPDAFSSSYEQEREYDEAFWRLRMTRSVRLLAEDGDEPVGTVSIGVASEEDLAELFGMWVDRSRRGSGIAWRLTDAAARHSAATGRRGLKLWVSTDNGRAVAFFSSYGFRPADERRLMAGADQGDGGEGGGAEAVEELAMVLPLRDHPDWAPAARP